MLPLRTIELCQNVLAKCLKHFAKIHSKVSVTKKIVKSQKKYLLPIFHCHPAIFFCMNEYDKSVRGTTFYKRNIFYIYT